MIVCQTCIAQKPPEGEVSNHELAHQITGLHTLTIHVRDTVTHDSVYQFLVDKLSCPVYYYPVTYGQTRYVGVYAGNMVLEPCGPYPNNKYATQNFSAIFFGLNFETTNPLSSSAKWLSDRGIKHQLNNSTSIYVKDTVLVKENVFVGLYQVTDMEKRDSLRHSLKSNSINTPGIEYIKEIFVGYNDEANLLKWKELVKPLKISEKNICQVNDSLEIHFIRSKIKEVKGITFKVKSIDSAKQYLRKNNLLGLIKENKIQLDKSNTFGLLIYLSEEE
jgi:hypothetical protein